MHNRRAKQLLISALDLWPEILGWAFKAIDEKDLAAAQKELASTAAKLNNADFLAKAPPQVVDKIRDRQRVAQEETDRINARLAGLQ